jgi:hypothetical protein
MRKRLSITFKENPGAPSRATGVGVVGNVRDIEFIIAPQV